MSISHKKYVWGVKIYLAQNVAENSDIGLYVESFGAADTQIDITVSGSTVTYTWDGTGTDPNFSTNGMNIGDCVIINAAAFNAANNGTFYITAVSDDAFSVINASGVAENNKVLGSTTAVKSAHQFRWIQNSITTTKTYKQEILVEESIAPIEQTADFTNGGNVAQVKGTTVTIKNIDGTNPLWNTLVTGGINLIGRRLQIIEFDHSASPATETILGTYIIDGAPVWNEGAFKIEALPAYYKRDILVGELVDNDPNNGNYKNAAADDVGKLIPITIGNIIKNDITTSFAKLIRVDNSGIAWTASDDVNLDGVFPAGQSTYPVTIAAALEYSILISNNALTVISLANLQAELIGQYLYVVSDTTNEGSYRKITNVTGGTTGVLVVTIQSPFSALLTAAGAAIGSVVSIMDCAREFICDSFPTIGTVETDGSALLSDPVVLVYNDGYTRIPHGAMTTKIGTNNNILEVDLETAKETPDRFIGIISLPLKSFEKLTDTTTIIQTLTHLKSEDGLYRQPIFITATKTSESGAGNESDRDGTSEYSITYSQTQADGTTGTSCMVFNAELPDMPEYFNFTKIYLGINFTSGSICSADHAIAEGLFIDCILKHWSEYTAQEIYIDDSHDMLGTLELNNLPTWHYTANPPANNSDYWTLTPLSPALNRYTGYNLIELKISTSSITYLNYVAISKLIVAMGFWITSGKIGTTYDIILAIKELSIMFYFDVSIGDEIFAPWKGRIFNDTWAGGRTGREKTATDMIESPIDVIEHFLRLQNWSDRDRAVNFGYEYAPNALINTATTDGGFDSAELNTLRTIKTARQITDEGEATTGKIIESLCRCFDLCSYQDNIGQECIANIMRTETTPDVSLTLNDIIPDSISDIEEIGPSNIYCEPYVEYAYNAATDKYDGIIRVTNASADTFNAAYVTGWAGTDAELIWNMAHALYLRYNMVTEPPKERTELKWIRLQEDAKDRLLAWLMYMGAYTTDGVTATAAARKRFSFSVPYATATTIGATHKPWHVAQQIDITLPHQTNGVSVRVIIESIKLDVNNNKADATVLSYDRTNEIQYFVKDTYGDSSPGLDGWKDTYQTQVEAPTNGNDIVNNF